MGSPEEGGRYGGGGEAPEKVQEQLWIPAPPTHIPAGGLAGAWTGGLTINPPLPRCRELPYAPATQVTGEDAHLAISAPPLLICSATCLPGGRRGREGGSRLSLAPFALLSPQPELGSGSIASLQDAGRGAPHPAPVHAGWAPCPACTAPPAGRRCRSLTRVSGPTPRDPVSACGLGSPTTTRSPNRWMVRPGAGEGR